MTNEAGQPTPVCTTRGREMRAAALQNGQEVRVGQTFCFSSLKGDVRIRGGAEEGAGAAASGGQESRPLAGGEQSLVGRRGVRVVSCSQRRVGVRRSPAGWWLVLSVMGSLAAAGTCLGEDSAAAAQAAFMQDRGLVRHEGHWRTPQEVWLLEQRRAADEARREWAAKLERLRRDSQDPARSSVAIESIREIDDPLAVPALAAAVSQDPQLRSRNWYLEALARIGTSEAIAALVTIGLEHNDPETRIAAVEQLAVDRPPMATLSFLAALRGPENARINRAAEALGQLGDESAVLPLVAALETEHTVIDPGSGGSLSATFTPGQGGLSAGGGPTQRRRRVRNEAVLEALVRLTGTNFEWRADAWRAWLAAEQNPDGFDPRRG